MSTEHDEIASLRAEVTALREELHKTLVLTKKIHHHNVISTTLGFMWAFILVGVPILVYIFRGSVFEVITSWISHAVQQVLHVNGDVMSVGQVFASYFCQ